MSPTTTADATAAVERRPSRIARGWAAVRTPVLAWTAITAVLVVLQHISNRVLRDRGYSIARWQGLHNYLDGWSQFDGPEYLKIVEHGYWYTPGVRSPIVWFPMYPIIVSAVHRVIADPMLAGMLVSAIGGVTAVSLYWIWLGRHGFGRDNRWVGLAVLMLYPYGWYLYGVVHSDSLFLAFLIGACLLLEADRPVLAGLVGALATATRPTAMAVIPGLIAIALEHGGVLSVPESAKGVVAKFRIPVHVDLKRLNWKVAAPALCIGGLAAWMIYLGVRFGDPIAFINNQRVYHPGNLPLLKRAFFVEIRDATDPRLPLTITGQAIVAALVLCSVPFVGRRFGWGYGVFTAVLVCIPTFSTEDFMGTGRYLIAAFPSMALAGEYLARRARLRTVWLVASGGLLLLMSFGFARSWYLT